MEDSFNLTDFDSLKEAFQVINATSLYLTEENNRFAANNIRLVQDNNYLSQENGQLKENLGIVENKLETVQGDLETVKEDLEKAEQKIAWFTEQIKLARQRQFGRKSEARLNQSNQLNLFDDTEYAEIEVGKENKPEIEVKDGQDEEQAATETITYTRNKPKGKNQGRRIDTSKLPREQIVHDLAEEQKRCGCCGNALEKIGEDVSEQLEYIPAQLKVIEHIRPKYTCRNCNTITTANKPEVPIAKCLAGASLITAVVIGKYEHHLPLYRQSKILLQDGADIPANTLGNWIMEAGEALEPLGEAFWQEIKKTDNLQVDETPVILLNQEKRGYMWCYHSLGYNAP
jgi:transposase